MCLCLFPHVDSSAVPVQQSVWGLRSLLKRIYLTLWSPEVWVTPRTTHPAPRPVTAMAPTFHLWTLPAPPCHQAPHLPVQSVRASGCFTGQAAPPRMNDRERLTPLQAWLPCSSFSIRRRVFPRPQRPTHSLEAHHSHDSPPLMETQGTRTTSQTPLRPRTAPTSPSLNLTSFPSTKRNPPPTASLPPTRRMQHLYVRTNLHRLYKCLYIPCGWVSLRTYIIIRVSGLKSGCADSEFGSIALCSYVRLSCASSGNEFKQRFWARAEFHTLNRSR